MYNNYKKYCSNNLSFFGVVEGVLYGEEAITKRSLRQIPEWLSQYIEKLFTQLYPSLSWWGISSIHIDDVTISVEKTWNDIHSLSSMSPDKLIDKKYLLWTIQWTITIISPLCLTTESIDPQQYFKRTISISQPIYATWPALYTYKQQPWSALAYTLGSLEHGNLYDENLLSAIWGNSLDEFGEQIDTHHAVLEKAIRTSLTNDVIDWFIINSDFYNKEISIAWLRSKKALHTYATEAQKMIPLHIMPVSQVYIHDTEGLFPKFSQSEWYRILPKETKKLTQWETFSARVDNNEYNKSGKWFVSLWTGDWSIEKHIKDIFWVDLAYFDISIPWLQSTLQTNGENENDTNNSNKKTIINWDFSNLSWLRDLSGYWTLMLWQTFGNFSEREKQYNKDNKQQTREAVYRWMETFLDEAHSNMHNNSHLVLWVSIQQDEETTRKRYFSEESQALLRLPFIAAGINAKHLETFFSYTAQDTWWTIVEVWVTFTWLPWWEQTVPINNDSYTFYDWQSVLVNSSYQFNETEEGISFHKQRMEKKWFELEEIDRGEHVILLALQKKSQRHIAEAHNTSPWQTIIESYMKQKLSKQKKKNALAWWISWLLLAVFITGIALLDKHVKRTAKAHKEQQKKTEELLQNFWLDPQNYWASMDPIYGTRTPYESLKDLQDHSKHIQEILSYRYGITISYKEVDKIWGDFYLDPKNEEIRDNKLGVIDKTDESLITIIDKHIMPSHKKTFASYNLRPHVFLLEHKEIMQETLPLIQDHINVEDNFFFFWRYTSSYQEFDEIEYIDQPFMGRDGMFYQLWIASYQWKKILVWRYDATQYWWTNEWREMSIKIWGEAIYEFFYCLPITTFIDDIEQYVTDNYYSNEWKLWSNIRTYLFDFLIQRDVLRESPTLVNSYDKGFFTDKFLIPLLAQDGIACKKKTTYQLYDKEPTPELSEQESRALIKQQTIQRPTIIHTIPHAIDMYNYLASFDRDHTHPFLSDQSITLDSINTINQALSIRPDPLRDQCLPYLLSHNYITNQQVEALSKKTMLKDLSAPLIGLHMEGATYRKFMDDDKLLALAVVQYINNRGKKLDQDSDASIFTGVASLDYHHNYITDQGAIEIIVHNGTIYGRPIHIHNYFMPWRKEVGTLWSRYEWFNEYYGQQFIEELEKKIWHEARTKREDKMSEKQKK